MTQVTTIFLQAGVSHVTHINAHLILHVIIPDAVFTDMFTPSQKSKSSFTKGRRNVLILCLGSEAPGIIPESNTFLVYTSLFLEGS